MESGWGQGKNKQFFPLLSRKTTCLFWNEFASIKHKKGQEMPYLFVQNAIRSVCPPEEAQGYGSCRAKR